MSKKKELIGNTFIIFIGKMLPQVLAFFMLFLYTNYLSTSEYGTIDLIITYVSLLAPIITLQLEMAMFRFLIDTRNHDDEKKKLITNNYICLIIFSFIFSIIYLLIMHFINFEFYLIILFYILSTIFMSNALQISRGLGENKTFALGSILNSIILVIFNIYFLVFAKLGMEGMLLSLLLANLITFIYLFFKLKLYNQISFKRFDKNKTKELIKYSLPLIPNGISWWVINVSDRTIISILLGTAANGIYAISNKFPAILSSFGGIFSLSWSESATLHINDKDRDIFFSKVCNSSLKIFGSMSILIITLIPFIFPILIDSSFSEAYKYIPILMLASLCNNMVICYSAIYIAKKLTKKVMNTSIMAAIINIVVNLVLIKFIGIYAAAISTFVAYLSMLIYRHFDVQKYVKIKYKFSLILNIVLMFILVSIIYYIDNLYLNIVSLIISVMFTFILNKKEINEIKNIVISKIKKSD